mmetsp:Transcript_9343/g.29469  ORF Transcript_9343/g.29469 Transcript_9343/m.29469 type:complete len:472 (+) Transcript_9343:83-1498(+)
MLIQQRLDTATELGVHHGEVAHHTTLDEGLGILEVAGDVAHQAVALLLRQGAPPEGAWLGEVVVVLVVVASHIAAQLLTVPCGTGHLRRAAEGVGEVVGCAALVRHSHEAVTLVVAHPRGERAVDGDLHVVGAQPVAVRVRVGEQARLQHLVRRRLNARHQLRRRECHLLHLREVVGRVAVQHDTTHRDERELRVRPDLGQVEGVEPMPLRLLEGHHLHVQRPGGELAACDRVVQVSDGIVGVGACQLRGLVHRQVLDALVRLVVELAVHCLSVSIDKLECVRAIAVHVAVSIRDATVGEEEADLMSRLRTQRDEVPEHIGILQVRSWVPLLGVDEGREQQRVPDEEDGSIVARERPVALLSVELDGKAARIAHSVRTSSFAAHSGESNGHRRPLAHLAEHCRLAVLGDLRRGHLEVAERARTLGVYNTLRDALAVEVRQLVDEGEILQEHGATRPSRHGRISRVHGGPGA